MACGRREKLHLLGPGDRGQMVDGHTGCGPSNCACPGPAALDRLVLFLIHTYIHAAMTPITPRVEWDRVSHSAVSVWSTVTGLTPI